MAKPVILWCVPRSASTAFERVFIETADVQVMHEPFSMSFYYSEERRSDRYVTQGSGNASHNYRCVLRRIVERSRMRFVFVKDLAYHVRGFWSSGLLRMVRSTFLIRNPIAALGSQYRLLPDFNLEETGYPELKRLFDAVADRDGKAPVLIDAADFQRFPDRVMAAYCDAIGIRFQHSSLTWENRDVPLWNAWRRWHLDALNSTGVNPPKPIPRLEDQPPHVRRMVDRTMPIYERLIPYKLQIEP